MALPDVRLIFKDGALGIQPAETDKIQIVFGVSSDGPANKLVPVTAKDQLRTTFNLGPLVQASALKLDIAGGPLYAVRVASSGPGSVTAVTATGQGAPAVSVSGAPLDSLSALIRITAGGGADAARFVYSLDNGQTFSPEVATAATFPLPDTGLTLAFPDGTYAVGHAYAFKTNAPEFTAAAFSDAFDAALKDVREWGIAHVVGTASVGTPVERANACVALAAAVETKMEAAENAYRYARAVIEAPDVEDSVLMNAFARFVGPHVAVVAGFGVTLSPVDASQKLRPLAWTILAQLMRKAIGKDPAQVETEPGTGPLPAALLSIARDESVTPSLDDARFVTVRTLIGETGFYVTNFPLMSRRGSDLKYIQHGQVLDHAAKVARGVLLHYLSHDLELKANGTLDEGEAQALDEKLEGALRDALVRPGHASAVVARANRTDDVLSTETLRGSFGVQPKFYPKMIEFEYGFTKSIPTDA